MHARLPLVPDQHRSSTTSGQLPAKPAARHMGGRDAPLHWPLPSLSIRHVFGGPQHVNKHLTSIYRDRHRVAGCIHRQTCVHAPSVFPQAFSFLTCSAVPPCRDLCLLLSAGITPCLLLTVPDASPCIIKHAPPPFVPICRMPARYVPHCFVEWMDGWIPARCLKSGRLTSAEYAYAHTAHHMHVHNTLHCPSPPCAHAHAHEPYG